MRFSWRTVGVAVLILLATAPAAHAERAFAPRYPATERGSVAAAGNTTLSCAQQQQGCPPARNGASGASGNNELPMVNVDVDGDASTFNSSRATLQLPAGATVLFAGLYWAPTRPQERRARRRRAPASATSYGWRRPPRATRRSPRPRSTSAARAIRASPT